MDNFPTHIGRVAVVTGAARGIGAAIAVGLAARGARVVVADMTYGGVVSDPHSATSHYKAASS